MARPVTTSSAKLRRRGPPPCFYPRKNVETLRLLAMLKRTEPAGAAAKVILDALMNERVG